MTYTEKKMGGGGTHATVKVGVDISIERSQQEKKKRRRCAGFERDHDFSLHFLYTYKS